MKKSILLFSLIMLISIMSCSSHTNINAHNKTDLASQIVGSWENEQTAKGITYWKKYIFFGNRKFSFYVAKGTKDYKKIFSSFYNVNSEMNRLTIYEDYGDLSMTLAIGNDKMIMNMISENIVMVGGDTDTLIGKWNSFFNIGGNSKDVVYDFKDDGTITVTVTGQDSELLTIYGTANANWVKNSDTTFTILNTNSEDIISTGIHSYQIIGKGVVFNDINDVDMYIYNKLTYSNN